MGIGQIMMLCADVFAAGPPAIRHASLPARARLAIDVLVYAVWAVSAPFLSPRMYNHQ